MKDSVTFPMESVYIVGFGSIGGLFGGHLAAARTARVIACTRRAAAPLVIDGPSGRLEVTVNCIRELEEAEPADWVLLATKSHETAGAAPWLSRLCSPRTRVAVLQNGVEQEDRVRPYIGGARLVPTIVFANAEKRAGESVLHRSPGRDLVVPDTDDGLRLLDLFAPTALQLRTDENFLRTAWIKLLANIVANPLTALTGRRLEVFHEPSMHAIMRSILLEGAAVGRAAGAPLEAEIEEHVVKLILAFPSDAGTSMLQDRLAGRPLESDALTGSIVRLGQRHRVSTPVNSAILTLLQTFAGPAA